MSPIHHDEEQLEDLRTGYLECLTNVHDSESDKYAINMANHS